MRPKEVKGILYEVMDYNGQNGEVILRRMYDEKQILLTKQTNQSNLKSIKGP